MNTDKQPFIIERSFHAPIEMVWQAITEAKEMKQWYFDIPSFKPVVGFEFSFTGENEGRKFIHLCKIIEVISKKKLSYSWRYKDQEGYSVVTFELFDEGAKTRLRLTHEGLHTFPKVKDFAKENFAMGWAQIIGTSLGNYLQKESGK